MPTCAFKQFLVAALAPPRLTLHCCADLDPPVQLKGNSGLTSQVIVQNDIYFFGTNSLLVLPQTVFPC